MAQLRKIVLIDEDKCNGCGVCVPACHEGAIEVIDGKARIVADVYCDGLGACLGECPQNAITIEEREAEAFDFGAAMAHVEAKQAARAPSASVRGGCPGAAAAALQPRPQQATDGAAEAGPSQLANWPVQLTLVPVNAPYLQGARLLIAADCVPFALADFHQRLLKDRVCLIGCPKLDDGASYVDKLAAMIAANDIESIDIAHMEVPCCHGLLRIVQQAVLKSGKDVPVATAQIGVRGDVSHRAYS